MTLAALGWNDSLAQAFAPYAAEGCAAARVTLELKGYCEVTGEPIGLGRLSARPIATMTVEAQEAHERREKISRDD